MFLHHRHLVVYCGLNIVSPLVLCYQPLHRLLSLPQVLSIRAPRLPLVVIPSATCPLLPSRAGMHFLWGLPDGGCAAGLKWGLGLVGVPVAVNVVSDDLCLQFLSTQPWLSGLTVAVLTLPDVQIYVSRLFSRWEDSDGPGPSAPVISQALPVPKKGGSLCLFIDLIRLDRFLVPPFKVGSVLDFAMGVLAGLWVYTLDLVVAYRCARGTGFPVLSGLCGLGSVCHYAPSLWAFCGSLGIHLRDPPGRGLFCY